MERIIIETGICICSKAMSFVGISNETLSIKVHVSGMKCVRDKGVKHVSGMKHIRECKTYIYEMCNTFQPLSSSSLHHSYFDARDSSESPPLRQGEFFVQH